MEMFDALASEVQQFLSVFFLRTISLVECAPMKTIDGVSLGFLLNFLTSPQLKTESCRNLCKQKKQPSVWIPLCEKICFYSFIIGVN